MTINLKNIKKYLNNTNGKSMMLIV